jgi:hypothetical protein
MSYSTIKNPVTTQAAGFFVGFVPQKIGKKTQIGGKLS